MAPHSNQQHARSHSEHCAPGVFVFNPLAEGRLAYGKAFNPTKHQAQLVRDLQNLPQFVCRGEDVVIVEQRPSAEFLRSLQQAGFAVPEFVEAGSGSGIQPLANRELGQLRPWAWSPDAIELLAPLFRNVTGEKRSAEQWFNPNIARLYSKAWSAGLLRRFLRDGPPEAWLCTENEIGTAATSVEEALAAIAAIRRRGHHRIAVKEAVGVAGSNAMRLFEPDLLETHRRWMANALTNGRELVIEPWLEREMDFSVQLEMTAGGLTLCGYTGLLNDLKGQFQANWAEPLHRKHLPAALAALFPETPDISDRLLQLYDNLFESLETEFRRAKYLGPIGIDAFAFRAPDGKCRIKPIVEINPRYTMGRLTVELMKHTCPGSAGIFRIINRPVLKASGFESFTQYANSLAKQFPVRLEGERVPRIREGAICLNDPARAESFLAVFQVGQNVQDLNIR
ncbi:MAG TPA: hypothetical protein VK327_01680 [Candidatus Paceibacterota bacterium]|nr:hypothetical protein [Candidatus Paceibacterota bacterium]